MTTHSIQSKIGTPHLFDQITDLYLCLPAPFLIQQHHRGIWMGGSRNGRQYLHIERIPTGEGRIPTILANGDLNIYLVGKDKPELINGFTQGLEVAGEISGRDVTGYMTHLRYSEKYSYLLFVAVENTMGMKSLREAVMGIVGKVVL